MLFDVGFFVAPVAVAAGSFFPVELVVVGVVECLVGFKSESFEVWGE